MSFHHCPPHCTFHHYGDIFINAPSLKKVLCLQRAWRNLSQVPYCTTIQHHHPTTCCTMVFEPQFPSKQRIKSSSVCYISDVHLCSAVCVAYRHCRLLVNTVSLWYWFRLVFSCFDPQHVLKWSWTAARKSPTAWWPTTRPFRTRSSRGPPYSATIIIPAIITTSRIGTWHRSKPARSPERTYLFIPDRSMP